MMCRDYLCEKNWTEDFFFFLRGRVRAGLIFLRLNNLTWRFFNFWSGGVILRWKILQQWGGWNKSAKCLFKR